MPTNITDVAAFTSPVVAPTDGDAANGSSIETMGQALANRTKYLSDKAEALRLSGANASYGVTASGLGAGGTATLTEQVASTGFVLASDEVEVPAAGRYLAILNASVTDSDTSDPTIQSLAITAGGAGFFFGSGARPSGTNTQTIPITVIGVFEITTPSTQKIKVQSGVNAGLTAAADSSRLTIVRLSELV